MTVDLRKEMRTKLSLISDDFGRAGRLGPVHVVVAPEHAPPFPIDAIAVEEAERRRLASLGIPLIGTRHGNVETRRVALWLGRCLSRTSFRYLKRVWVIAPEGSETELMWALRSEFAGK
jgi:hypothetical protein